jgi:hypothetical protein
VPAVAYIVALPALALAARLPDTVLTGGLHVLSGATLVWLAVSLAPARATATAPARA